MTAIEEGKTLPDKSMLLTFDDGYIDHFTNVFPILYENELQGSFFMPAKILSENKLLDVNKIHYILASKSTAALLNDVMEKLDYYRGDTFKIDNSEILYKKLAVANRFDNKDVIFIKRLLQVELEEELRNKITDDLFKENISIPESTFCKEVYMSYDQLKLMKRCGMHFGLHGYDHCWLGRLSKEAITKDIDSALDYYKEIIDRDRWSICYPYGSYNDDLLNYAKKKKAMIGLTTQVGVANLSIDNNLLLPRLDTNDFLV